MKGKIVKSDSGTEYRYINKLGSGTYGTTWEAIKVGSKKKVAVKEFTRPGKDLDPEQLEDIIEDWEVEVDALKKIIPKCYPHAVCIGEFWFGKNGARLTMDYVRGESLNSQIMRTIPLKKRQYDHSLLRNLIIGISAIHSLGVTHQDIKGENIMCDFNLDGRYRYIDFGLSCVRKGKNQVMLKNRDNWPCGTIGTRYTAPLDIARISGKEGIVSWKQLFAHDYWSIGIVLLRWYTFDGSVNYYSKRIMDVATTYKLGLKMMNEGNGNSPYPYYYKFSRKLLKAEIAKIKECAAREIVGFLLEPSFEKRWANFQTLKKLVKNIKQK